MNLQAIIVTNCVGFTLLFILLISSYLVRQRRQFSDIIFTFMIVISSSACITEMFTFIIDGKQFWGAEIINLLFNSWLYIANIMVSFVWCVYVDLRLYHSKERIIKYYSKAAIPAVLAIILIFFNLKFQFIFSIDENNIYVRKFIGSLYFVFTFSYLIYSLIVRRIYYMKNGKNRFFPIYMFITPIIIGAVLQLMFYGISLAWCSVSLGLVGIYMSLQNELSYIDPLTKLYNRNYLDHVLKEIKRKNYHAGGIMIDIDYFKLINDKFGHSTGDEALIEAAGIIRKCTPSKAVPVRFAGDEFVVIMRSASDEKLKSLKEALHSSVEYFNETSGKPYKLSFSIGGGLCGSGVSADKFLNEMDENMYIEKKEKHSRSAVHR